MKPEVNIDLGVDALGAIKLHPELHEQGHWRCDTGMCFAGWVGELDAEVEWATDDVDSPYASEVRVKATGQIVHVSVWAMKRLGLSEDDATGLFAYNRTVGELEAGITALKNGENVYKAVMAAKNAADEVPF